MIITMLKFVSEFLSKIDSNSLRNYTFGDMSKLDFDPGRNNVTLDGQTHPISFKEGFCAKR
jgi:hypothetical protein